MLACTNVRPLLYISFPLYGRPAIQLIAPHGPPPVSQPGEVKPSRLGPPNILVDPCLYVKNPHSCFPAGPGNRGLYFGTGLQLCMWKKTALNFSLHVVFPLLQAGSQMEKVGSQPCTLIKGLLKCKKRSIIFTLCI